MSGPPPPPPPPASAPKQKTYREQMEEDKKHAVVSREVIWCDKYPIHAAAAAADMSLLERFLPTSIQPHERERYHTALNQKDEDSWSPLHYACWYGHLEIIERLLRLGVDYHVVNLNGATALHFASGCGHTRAAMSLLEAGADPTLRDQDSATPLHLVHRLLVPKNHPEAANLLVLLAIGRFFMPIRVNSSVSVEFYSSLQQERASAEAFQRRPAEALPKSRNSTETTQQASSEDIHARHADDEAQLQNLLSDDPYRVLGLSPAGCSVESVSKAFRALSVSWHPDRPPSSSSSSSSSLSSSIPTDSLSSASESAGQEDDKRQVYRTVFDNITSARVLLLKHLGGEELTDMEQQRITRSLESAEVVILPSAMDTARPTKRLLELAKERGDILIWVPRSVIPRVGWEANDM
eukprot:gb/GEZN01006966.1/.p1 GENE.gb/GEZN01006966.1/~~gb/GEZN01006966.1/.p1  ORF type:complete len:409 (+),score=61.15 gb/GEZN01006966.1/:148-1374(+)